MHIPTTPTAWGTRKSHGLANGETFLYAGNNRNHPDTPVLAVLDITNPADVVIRDEAGNRIGGGGAATRFHAARLVTDQAVEPTEEPEEVHTTDTLEGSTAQDFVADYLGEGNWEVTAPNGVWTVTADNADPETAGTAFHIEGPNHHHGEFWADSMDEAWAIIRTHGVDRRTTRHAA